MSDPSELEEINRTRIAAGLAPIPVPGGEDAAAGGDEAMQVEEDPDVVAQRNYQERVEQDKKDREAKEIRERIAKAKNQRALNAKLQGTTLGAPSDTEESTLSWLKKAKRKQKSVQKELDLAAKREQEERERELQAVYGAEDLRGIKVAHSTKDLGGLEDGNEVILTLKDSKILEDQEDELQNVALADEQRRKAAHQRKKRAKDGYTGYDDEEFDEERGPGMARNVLSKYDDEYEGEGVTVEGFRLGGASPPPPVSADAGAKRKREDGSGLGIVDDDEVDQGPSTRVNKQLLNLDYTKNFEGSDYLAEETKFKKKKKVKRSTRQRESDLAGPSTTESPSQDVTMASDPDQKPKIDLDRTTADNLVDDDDLQMALSRQRKKAMMKRPKQRPEDIAARIMASRSQEQEGGATESQVKTEDDSGGLTFDDTSEFVRNVSLDNVLVKREPAQPSKLNGLPEGVTVKQEEGEDHVSKIRVKMEIEDEPLGGYGVATAAGPSVEDVEMARAGEDGELSEDDDELAEMALRQGLSIQEMRLKLDAELGNGIKQEEGDPIVKSEPVVAGGVAGALAILRQQGALKETTREQAERERTQKERDLWLADHRRRIAKRELERQKLKGAGYQRDQAQREWEIKTREQQEAREALSAFKDYKPDVKIEYTDEFGRVMTPKEAWKSLSHKFHGKTSGRKKTELRLRRVDEERKREAMVAGDTASGMIQAFARRQEATGEAYMTLSLGNRNYVPSGQVKTKDGVVMPGGGSKNAQHGGASGSTGKGGKKSAGGQSGPKVLG